MKLVLSLILFSFLWGAHHCSPRRIFMLSFPRTGVRSHLTHLTMPDRVAEREAPTAATKRNIAAMARDNQIPATKRFEEEVIFEDDGEIFMQKRDYGEELGADAAYDDPRDKNDRKIYKRDEEAMSRSYDRNREVYPILKSIKYGQG